MTVSGDAIKTSSRAFSTLVSGHPCVGIISFGAWAGQGVVVVAVTLIELMKSMYFQSQIIFIYKYLLNNQIDKE